MDDLEQKLGAVLNNPQLMQQIMSMAQAMGSPSPPPPEQKQPEPAALPPIDPGMLAKLAGLSKQSHIDRDQQALLNALNPYLTKDRIGRLERAMRAAKMAKLAGSFLGSGLLTNWGR